MTKEDLQLRWDEILIQARFFCMDAKLKDIEYCFSTTYGGTPRDLGLLRAPLDGYNWTKTTALLFICEHLPKIAAHCWKYTAKDWEKVLVAVNKSNHNTKKIAASHVTKTLEVAEMGKTERQYRDARVKKEAMSALYASHRTSNQWGVCK